MSIFHHRPLYSTELFNLVNNVPYILKSQGRPHNDTERSSQPQQAKENTYLVMPGPIYDSVN